MRESTKITIFLFIFSFLLYFIAFIRIPLHSDVTWIFRLQTMADPKLQKTLPESFKKIGAENVSQSEIFRRWYAYSGRFNFLDMLSLRLMAGAARGNADLWRFINLIFMSASLGLIFQINRKFIASNSWNGFFCLGLVFYPSAVWFDYKTSEPRALFFFLLAFYLIIYRFQNSFARAAAGILMLASLLTKETFISGWLVLSGYFLYKKAMKFSFWHVVSLVLFIFFVVWVKNYYPQKTSYLINEGDGLNLGRFGLSLFRGLIPGTLNFYQPLPKFIIFLLFLNLPFNRILSENIHGIFARVKTFLRNRRVIFCIALILAISLHALIYFLSGRDLNNRYIIPANIYAIFLISLFVSHFQKQVATLTKKHLWHGIVILLFFLWVPFTFPRAIINTLILLIMIVISKKFILTKHLLFLTAGLLLFLNSEKVIDLVFQERVDQDVWQRLNAEVLQAPPNSLINLRFREPGMTETAYSLRANMLIAGRNDLKYRLSFQNTSLLKRNMLVRQSWQDFNDDNKDDGIIKKELSVQADRDGDRTKIIPPISLPKLAALLFKNPWAFIVYRFTEGKIPYLKYTVR